jgi:hypothetical protein
VYGAGPQPGDNVGRTVLGDVIPAPWSSGVMHPGIAGLLLSGPLGSPSPPIDWGQVEECGVQMFTGCHHGEAAARTIGLGRVEYLASDTS